MAKSKPDEMPAEVVEEAADPAETAAEDAAPVEVVEDAAAEDEPAAVDALAALNNEPAAAEVELPGVIDTVAEPSGPAYDSARDGLLLRLEEVCRYARSFDYPLDDTARALIAELAAHG